MNGLAAALVRPARSSPVLFDTHDSGDPCDDDVLGERVRLRRAVQYEDVSLRVVFPFALGEWGRGMRKGAGRGWGGRETKKECPIPSSLQSSGAVWKSRWPSWAFRPNEPYGFCGRKATLNRVSALVKFVPNMSTDVRGHEALLHHQQPSPGTCYLLHVNGGYVDSFPILRLVSSELKAHEL